jgi:hypothetical protein
LRNIQDLIVGGYGSAGLLACPKCGFENGMHLNSIQVLTGDALTVVDAAGTRVVADKKAMDEAEANRGSIVKIEYSCEGCSTGLICLGFNKGTVWVRTEELPKEQGSKHDIWRT